MKRQYVLISLIFSCIVAILFLISHNESYYHFTLEDNINEVWDSETSEDSTRFLTEEVYWVTDTEYSLDELLGTRVGDLIYIREIFCDRLKCDLFSSYKGLGGFRIKLEFGNGDCEIVERKCTCFDFNNALDISLRDNAIRSMEIVLFPVEGKDYTVEEIKNCKVIKQINKQTLKAKKNGIYILMDNNYNIVDVKELKKQEVIQVDYGTLYLIYLEE